MSNVRKKNPYHLFFQTIKGEEKMKGGRVGRMDGRRGGGVGEVKWKAEDGE